MKPIKMSVNKIKFNKIKIKMHMYFLRLTEIPDPLQYMQISLRQKFQHQKQDAFWPSN